MQIKKKKKAKYIIIKLQKTRQRKFLKQDRENKDRMNW